RLGEGGHGHSGHHADLEAVVLRLECSPQHEAVEHRSGHADVVGFDAVDSPLVGDASPKDVASADHHRHLDARIGERDDLACQAVDDVAVESPVLRAGERSAAHLHDHPSISVHLLASLDVRTVRGWMLTLPDSNRLRGTWRLARSRALDKAEDVTYERDQQSKSHRSHPEGL